MTKLTTAARTAVRDRFPNLAKDVKSFPVRDGEEPWTLREVEELAAELLSEKERLEGELASADEELSNLLRHSGDGAGDDQADSGSSALEREQELTLVNNVRDLLAQTSHALDRIAAGTYATCEETGLPIGKARLQAFPRANLSVEAKQRAERR
ncbi:TraR/DksA family transcriptional regulator [Cellulosimicrobium cellulans]|jgi:DnaK suppressor protein|uniref:DNA-binding protein n=2 Tax=Cellulosimicrobium TaxID=157920 RepID=A0A0H2KIU7_9MICO|nr:MULTISPECIES: TraR/DksA C4-type zinc finger protein [Cellulosimicrobium]KLN33600.1 DNA-binding protein [Cellulosimicrobium funkei]KON71873.1 DNA-binding protein [Cellulosimicrobium cellulans F16]KZM79142.1 DNA-binding protein [Cellulosimicrobium sp. I38E]MBN0041535.1 TraR/DksA family transcriptional regulator [Cellulosimicrobium cellulans]UKJ64548.1 TraR/DksA family transcriptional regulator [Cellulosimicrobium cellulans]